MIPQADRVSGRDRIAEHVAQKMLEHYSRIRLDAKRTPLAALSQRSTEPGYGTNSDINGTQWGDSDAKVILPVDGHKRLFRRHTRDYLAAVAAINSEILVCR